MRDILRQHAARQVEAEAERRVLAPRASVRVVGRIGEAAGRAQCLADLGVSTGERFPIV